MSKEKIGKLSWPLRFAMYGGTLGALTGAGVGAATAEKGSRTRGALKGGAVGGLVGGVTAPIALLANERLRTSRRQSALNKVVEPIRKEYEAAKSEVDAAQKTYDGYRNRLNSFYDKKKLCCFGFSRRTGGTRKSYGSTWQRSPKSAL